MREAVEAARRATRSLQSQARTTSQRLAALDDEIGVILDSFEIVGEIPDVLLDHIRAAAEGHPQIRVLVTAIGDRTDQGDRSCQ